MGVEEAYRWKDSVQSEAEIRIWCRRRGRQRPAALVHQVRRHAPRPPLARASSRTCTAGTTALERYLRNEAPLARVGLVYSQQTAWFYGGPRAREKVEDHALGWYQALIEARIPFEMVHDRLLDEAHLAQFKTLILPNIAALSDEQCRQLRAFVERGGGLVATYETSLYDEWGERRADFGLADLFGVSFRRRGRGADAERLPAPRGATRARGRRHPLLAGLDDAGGSSTGPGGSRSTPTVAFPHRR